MSIFEAKNYVMSANEIVISGYKPFLIQKGNDEVKNSNEQWGVVVQSFPYKLLPKPKDPPKNDWHDQDGDDEYNSTMHYEAYEIEVDFYARARDNTTLRTNIKAFFDYIKEGEFKIYDTYTGIGRQNVRYADYDPNSYKDKGGRARLIFKIKFKVNDPITQIVLTEN